jgi:hypothetical protein
MARRLLALLLICLIAIGIIVYVVRDLNRLVVLGILFFSVLAVGVAVYIARNIRRSNNTLNTTDAIALLGTLLSAIAIFVTVLTTNQNTPLQTTTPVQQATAKPQAIATNTISSNDRISLNQTIQGKLYYNESNTWLFNDGPELVNIILDTGPTGDALLILYDPSGVQLEYVPAQSDGKARLLNYQIPDTREYALVVRNAKNTEVEYTLTVETALPAGNIKLNQTVQGKLYYNEGSTWLFSDGPETVNIILDTGPTGDALLILYDPSGVQLEYVPAQSDGKARLLNYQIPDTREYALVVRNAKNTEVEYTLTVEAGK